VCGWCLGEGELRPQPHECCKEDSYRCHPSTSQRRFKTKGRRPGGALGANRSCKPSVTAPWGQPLHCHHRKKAYINYTTLQTLVLSCRWRHPLVGGDNWRSWLTSSDISNYGSSAIIRSYLFLPLCSIPVVDVYFALFAPFCSTARSASKRCRLLRLLHPLTGRING
jgi:hypothetical protein